MFRESSVKFNNKKGFTLAELLTVLGITVILLAIGMIAILHYSNILKLTQMDNTSKEIFIAAQNHLTHAQTSGALKAYDVNNGDGKLGSAMTNEPSDFTEATGKTWPEGGKDTDNAYYYVVYKPGDTSLLKDSILKDMLPYGSISEDVRTDGYYIIEYNIKTATVYGVFYNDSKDLTVSDEGSGIYLNNSADGAKVRGDSDSEKTARIGYKSASSANFVLGYYGGAMVNVLGTKITEPTIDVNNGDKLEVKITDPNYFKSVGGTQLKSYITLTVKGVESNAEKTLTLDLNDAGDKGSQTTDNKGYFGSWSVKSNDSSTAKIYTVDLDDITRAGGHFAEMFPDFIPGEDINLQATCSSNSVLTTVASSDTAMTNSLFESVTPDMTGTTYDGTGTANVTCIRHIENLDAGISNIPTAKNTSPSSTASTKNQYYINSAVVTKNIDYDTFTAKVEDSSNNFSIYLYKKSDAIASNSYYGIRNDVIRAYDGGGKTIKNIVINNADTSPATSTSDDCNAGLIRYVNTNIGGSTELKNFILKDFSIYGYKNAGVLAAEVNGESKNINTKVSVTNVLVDGGSVSSGKDSGKANNAGGLIGYAKANLLSISDCASTATCKSAYGSAGGFIAKIGGAATISNCYTGGRTVNGKYSTENYNIESTLTSNNNMGVGGFIGAIQGTSNLGAINISNCYSTCSVKGYWAGGFIGHGEGSGTKKTTDCYATGLVSGTSSEPFFASKSDTWTMSDDYYLDGVNGSNTDKYATLCKAGDTTNTVVYGSVSNSESHPFDNTLVNYPFKMVNKTGAVNSDNYAHYGDWPKVEKDIVGTNLFAYREGNAIDGYKWYVKGTTVNEDGGYVFKTVYDNLIKTRGRYINSDEPTYGLLSTTNKIPSVGNKNQFKSAGVPVTIGNKNYYFFETTKKSGKGIQETGDWILDSDSHYYVDYYYNVDFGAAISTGKSYLGTQNNPYQVRTETQLNNINGYYSYLSDYYVQSIDINLADTYRKPIVYTGSFAGTYDATYSGSTGYSISGLNMTVDGYHYYGAGLFSDNVGTLKGINLTDSQITVNHNTENVGTIAAENGGKLENCKSDDSVTLNVDITSYSVYFTQSVYYSTSGAGVDTAMNIGGLVGQLYGSSSVDNCYSNSTVNFDGAGSSDINIGGFAGLSRYDFTENNEPNINSSYSSNAMNINYAGRGSSDIANTGGFVGLSIGSNYYYCNTKSSIINESNYTNTGGFIGYAVTYRDWIRSYDWYMLCSEDYSKASISVASTADDTAVGGFVGVVRNNGSDNHNPNFINCYASTDFTGNNANAKLFVFNQNGVTSFNNCHAVERNGDTMILSSKFMNVNGLNPSTHCYTYSKPLNWTPTDVVYVNDPAKYRILLSLLVGIRISGK
jgi:prepilin-type N-terminal cleavage/methylation domain-containing protein